jgi:DNA primase
MSKLEEILSRLENVKKSGSGYRALCPAHDDKNPSLSITKKMENSYSLFCRMFTG